MTEQASVQTGNVSAAVDTCSSASDSTDPRMTLYNQREQEFYDFLKQTNNTVDNDSGTDVSSPHDMPLSGLQCLLALTEILDKAARLRVVNYNLEQRIEVLQQFKLLAEVQNELHNATVDVNTNGLVKSKKSRTTDELDSVKLVRANSEESLEGYSHSRLHNSEEELSRHRSTMIKSSRLSETWGKVKDKLAPKETNNNSTAPSHKQSKRHRSTDLAGSTGHGSITQAPDLVASATTPAIQFTQREIQIALPIEAAAVVDYGGVWLGDDDTNNTDQPGLIDYGGVYLGPSTSPPRSKQDGADGKVKPDQNDNTQYTKETRQVVCGSHETDGLLRKVSEPAQPTESYHNSEFPKRISLDDLSKPKSTSNDELNARTNIKHSVGGTSPLPARKKSSKLLGQTVLRLSGAEPKKSRTKESPDNLPKDFKKKMEEWQTMKDNQDQAMDNSTTSKQRKTSATATKAKTQRVKNKKRGGILKRRSKSAERIVEDHSVGNVADSDASHRTSNEFEEKLREWSVKQGYHPTYYSEFRDRVGSHGSMVGESGKRRTLGRGFGDAKSESSIQISLQKASPPSSPRAASAGCLPPMSTKHTFRSADDFHTLYEISKSTDTVFINSSQTPRKLSRSEEHINTVASGTQLGLPDTVLEQSATDSNIDLYARASDESLEKHLSLCAVNSMSSINMAAYPNGSPKPKARVSTDIKNKPNASSVRGHAAKKYASASSLVLDTDIFTDRSRAGSFENTVRKSPKPSKPQDDAIAKPPDTTLVVECKTVNDGPKFPSPPVERDDSQKVEVKLSEKSEGKSSALFYLPHQIENRSTAKMSDTTLPSQLRELDLFAEHSKLPVLPTYISADMLLDDPFQAGKLSNASSYNKLPSCNNSASNSPRTVTPAADVGRVRSDTSTISSGSNFISRIDETLTTKGNADETALSDDVISDDDIIDRIVVPDIITIDSEVCDLAADEKIEDERLEDDDIGETAEQTEVAKNSIGDNKILEDIIPSSIQEITVQTERDHGQGGEYHKSGSAETQQKIVVKNIGNNDTGNGLDINRNITESSMPKAQDSTSMPVSTPTDQVPLKMRLKSLAMEYEVEETKQQQIQQQMQKQQHHRYGSPSVHKRTRSFDYLSTSNLTSTFPSRQVDSAHSTSDKDNTLKQNGRNVGNGTETKSSTINNQFLPSISSSNLQRSNVHRLKSADELIYEHSPNTNRRHYTRPSSFDGLKYARFDFVNRRELNERPKAGTVMKTRSLFISDNGVFNSQFGTDFGRPRSALLK